MQLVKNHISDLVEEDVDSIRIATVEGDLEKIQEQRDHYRSNVEDLLEDFAEELDTAARTSCQGSGAVKSAASFMISPGRVATLASSFAGRTWA